MRKQILLFILFCFAFSVNCFGFKLDVYLEDYLKKEFGFEEVYIDNLKLNGKLDELPDNLQIERFYGRYLKFSCVKDGKVFDGKADIRAFKKVITAKYGLEKGRELAEEDVVERLIEFSKVPKGAITDISTVLGKTLKSSIQANGVITENKLITVKKGETVVIKIERPTFSLKMEGKALEDGYSGRLIRVLNLSSNKVIKGMVQDDKTIILSF
jgi:flagella basal body P-ring formation protein FlgA